ncbi:DeoR/GlpR family DNA-binding transcription regulator [Aestuariivirga sp.]|uniref:DeoR/GlpR family DNA-binding transcription regulator n=1 Tax=Aestuariivirga sp. TaxID=2650926 RepID=UPI0035931100
MTYRDNSCKFVHYRVMLTDQRKHFLLQRLHHDGRIVAKELSAELALSEDTIRRDLRELAAEGLLLRVHGGALPSSPTVASLDVRRGLAMDEKRKLARVAASLVDRGQTVFIDGGTTNLELVRCLALDLVATIITHSPSIASALEPHQGIEVIMVGGTLLRHSMVNVGAIAFETINRLRADLCFIGLTGLHAGEGATTGNFEEAAIKRLIISRSAETVSIVTTEKLGAVSLHAICPAASLATIVVPSQADTGQLANHLTIIRA